MKKILMFLLCLMGLATIAFAEYKPTTHEGGVRLTPSTRGQNQQMLLIENPSGTTIFKIDNQGRINPQDIVVLNAPSQLSTWSGAAAGSSYYQTEPNKTYVVDLLAIATSNDNGTQAVAGGTTSFGDGVDWSGVTLHLPLATADDDKKTVKVILANTGSYPGISSGATTVQIWPAPDAGTTTFRANATLSQNMLGATTSGSSAFTVNVTGDVSLTHIGGSYEFMLFNNSAVSASPLSLPYNFGTN